jgi:acyl-CoA synthetase (NDP forming)
VTLEPSAPATQGAGVDDSTADVPAIDLRALFAPASVAVVGASSRSGIAKTVRDNLRVMASSTRCYFVNPRYEELLGERCYPSIDALPERPDTVLAAVNPLRATAVAEAAAAAGVPSLVIPGGGVVEGGTAAARMQAEVREIAIRHGIALLGPNCMGVVDLVENSATYIGDVNPWLPRGGIAGIAQSGSVTDAFIHSGSRIGFSRIIGCGSEAVVDACDYLAYCLDDPATEAVIMFLEGFKRPERFLALADRALEIGKPVMVVKVGRSPQAQAATVAHSGSLAGEDRATDAALRAAGVIRCDDLDELLETAELVSGCRRLGRGVGAGRTGVVTVSTGEASLIADLAPRTRVSLPAVPESARARLMDELPTLGYIGNPLDPWGAAEPAAAYRAAFEAFAESGAFDVLAIVHDFPYRSLPSEVETARDVTAELLAAVEGRPDILPVYVSLTSGDPPPETQDHLRLAGGVPILRGAVEAFTAIAAVARWETARATRAKRGPHRPSWPSLGSSRVLWAHDGATSAASPASDGTGASSSRRVLPERESLALLASAGVPVVDVVPVSDAASAVVAADRLGRPVALKLDVVGLPHKSDVGGVRLGLVGRQAVRAGATELLAIGRALGDGPGVIVRGLLVEPMASTGVELLVGMKRDPQFGPVIVAGPGGVLAEIVDDVALRLGPIDVDEALEMLAETRAAHLLGGVRGREPVDRDAVAAVLVALSDLADQRADIVAIDVNPLVAGPAGVVAVDALVEVETG